MKCQFNIGNDGQRCNEEAMFMVESFGHTRPICSEHIKLFYATLKEGHDFFIYSLGNHSHPHEHCE